MAAKYQLITELYRRTGIAVAKNPQAWQGFLSSACRNYKCRFDEQLLIYAQRPDAVAVAKLETWNRQFKRWVNKDSKGIAVFDPKGRRNTLKYYFDVSDTHEGYYGSRPVPIWQMDERYEQAVMERLSDRFGDVESTDLASALMETAKNAVEDNLQDYFSQLKDCTKDSFLEELDDFNIEVIYRRLAANSVAFMLISRCGLDMNEFFDRDDFADIVNFNTPATINAIGIATSDIAEMALREISQSIRNVQIAEKDQNRTFAQRTQAQYDKDRQQPERSEYNERNHLQQTGGLSYSRPNITDRARASAWQVRFDAQGLSGEAQASDLSQSADIGQAERASARGRADSTPEVGASDEAALSRAGRDRGTERESTDAVGRTDEQHPQSSGGSDTDRTDLQVSVAKEDEVRVNLPTVDEQIEMIAEAEDENASAFTISKEDIDSVLQKGSGVADGKYRIYRQFQKGEDRQKNIEFLKNEYGTGGGTHIFPDGFSGHSWHDSKGLAIDRNGTYTNHDLVLKWSQVEKRLREMIKDNRYLNPKEKDHYADYLESIDRDHQPGYDPGGPDAQLPDSVHCRRGRHHQGGGYAQQGSDIHGQQRSGERHGFRDHRERPEAGLERSDYGWPDLYHHLLRDGDGGCCRQCEQHGDRGRAQLQHGDHAAGAAWHADHLQDGDGRGQPGYRRGCCQGQGVHLHGGDRKSVV